MVLCLGCYLDLLLATLTQPLWQDPASRLNGFQVSTSPNLFRYQSALNHRGQKLNTNFFLKLFEHPRDIPAKIPGDPAKMFGFPGFRRTCRTFWPPHLHVEDPHPTRRYPDQKVWVWVLFSSLKSTGDPGTRLLASTRQETLTKSSVIGGKTLCHTCCFEPQANVLDRIRMLPVSLPSGNFSMEMFARASWQMIGKAASTTEEQMCKAIWHYATKAETHCRRQCIPLPTRDPYCIAFRTTGCQLPAKKGCKVERRTK